MERNELINKLKVANFAINQDYAPYYEVFQEYRNAATRGYFFRAILLVYATTLLLSPVIVPLIFLLRPIIDRGVETIVEAAPVIAAEALIVFLGIKVGKYLTRHAKFFMTRKYAMSKINAAEKEYYEKIANDEKRLGVVPSEYWYPEAIGYILRMIETERAETVAQALSLYDEYSYRQDTKNQMDEIARRQEEIARWPYY